jgi:hypothetical protein
MGGAPQSTQRSEVREREKPGMRRMASVWEQGAGHEEGPGGKTAADLGLVESG